MWSLQIALPLLALILPSVAVASPVLMISIDGLRPADILEAEHRGIRIPILEGLAKGGAYATDVINVTPTVTYPNHTTLITGVAPRFHGIANNEMFDPLRKNQSGWYWYTSDIHRPTLWDAVHAKGGVVANIGWPVSVGARSIDDNIPEYWRAQNAEDIKLLQVLSTQGLPEQLEAASGVSLATVGGGTMPDNDEAKAKFAAALCQLKRPRLFTIHLSSLDHIQHIYGPGTPQAHEALERLDKDVRTIVEAARAAQPDVVVALVSDHGFTEVAHAVNLFRPFLDAGLITLGPSTHKPTSWDAEPWGGASVAVVLARPDDETLRAKVAALLIKLRGDPAYHIASVIDGAEIARRGIGGEASFYIDFELGFEMGQDFDAPQLSPTLTRGAHGYFSDQAQMHSTLILNGQSLWKTGSLGQVDMRDVAPTLAKILGVELPAAEGKSLF